MNIPWQWEKSALGNYFHIRKTFHETPKPCPLTWESNCTPSRQPWAISVPRCSCCGTDWWRSLSCCWSPTPPVTEKRGSGGWKWKETAVLQRETDIAGLWQPRLIIHTGERAVKPVACQRSGFGIVLPFIKEICRSIALSAMQCQHFQSTDVLNNSKLYLQLMLWTFLWRS